jgi:multicomponent Na+:H+ antiporter subunit D
MPSLDTTLTLIPSTTPLLAVLVSMAAVPLIAASGRWPNLREGWTFAAALAKAGLVVSMLPAVLAGDVLECRLWELSPGLELALRVDAMGMVFALVASLLWILTSCYSVGYVRGAGELRQTRYFAFFALCLSAAIGLSFAANLLTFVVFWELLSLSAWPLVLHKHTPEAVAGARRYLCFQIPASLCLVTATAWCLTVTGPVDFRAGGWPALAALSDGQLQALAALFLVGVGTKAALLPLQSWLPAAMVAPTPVSALLHAVAVVKAGVFGVLRVTGFVFGPALMTRIGVTNVLAWVAAVTLLAGSLVALRQDNLKRRLAWSTVAHLSYIVLGCALLTPSSWTGSVMHLGTHATMKITLFFCAGAIYVRTHKVNVSDMAGIGRQMPLTMAAFAIGSLGLIGVPGVNGFVSKWMLALGTLEAGQVAFLVSLLLSGLLNAAYLLPVVHTAFFETSPRFPRFGEARALMLVPLLVTALVSVVLGFAPNLGMHLWDLARAVSLSVVGAP